MRHFTDPKLTGTEQDASLETGNMSEEKKVWQHKCFLFIFKNFFKSIVILILSVFFPPLQTHVGLTRPVAEKM